LISEDEEKLALEKDKDLNSDSEDIFYKVNLSFKHSTDLII